MRRTRRAFLGALGVILGAVGLAPLAGVRASGASGPPSNDDIRQARERYRADHSVANQREVERLYDRAMAFAWSGDANTMLPPELRSELPEARTVPRLAAAKTAVDPALTGERPGILTFSPSWTDGMGVSYHQPPTVYTRTPGYVLPDGKGG